MTAPLWQPSAERIRRSHLTSFLRALTEDHGSVIHGEPVDNREALANPEALDWFASLEDLQS